MTKKDILKILELVPHPTEGGYFRRTYESTDEVNVGLSNKKLLTSIYYLLTDDSPIGYLHRNQSDIIHYYHIGSPIRYFIISQDGQLKEKVLGPNIAQGEVLQLLVKGGEWKAAELCSGSFGLLSEAVSPGFNYVDNEVANDKLIDGLYPQHLVRLHKYIKRNKI